MRRISLVLIVLLALGALPSAAEPFRAGREERRALDRIVRVIKSFFGVQTNGDGLTPPLPGSRP